jgi:serine/threonine protein kinase
MLTSERTAKLGDLGLCRTMRSDAFARSLAGTPMFMAPEVLEGRPYDHKADVWSIGCVLLVLLCDRRELAEERLLGVIAYNGDGELEKMVAMTKCRPAVGKFFARTLRRDAEGRATAKEALAILSKCRV